MRITYWFLTLVNENASKDNIRKAPKIYLNKTVFDAAKERIRYIFSEFDNVVVGFSGGKDSTATLFTTLMVAEEMGRLPVKVCFVDQEAEWQAVIDYMRIIMSDPRVDPYWIQAPLKLFNATSPGNPWLRCWDKEEEDTWMREREPNSIKINEFGTDRFKDIFGGILKHLYPKDNACYLSGVRTEESPARFIALTNSPTYKHITYGKILNKRRNHYTFYPLYDWSYTDVWKAIHDNKWQYCKIYDYYYQHGVELRNMRVSNLHHETAVHALFFLQEIEGDTWTKLTSRLSGINTAGKLGEADFFCPKSLPYMFESWREYRDYLLLNLITDESYRDNMAVKFSRMDEFYKDFPSIGELHRQMVTVILTNDYFYTKLDNWERRPAINVWRNWSLGKITYGSVRRKQYLRYVNGSISKGHAHGFRRKSPE